MEFGTFYQQVERAVQAGDVKSIPAALEAYKQMGLSYVDVDSGIATPDASPQELLKSLKDCGIRVGSVFCWHRFPHMESNYMELMREHTKKQLDYIAALECDIFMPVPFVGGVHATPEDRRICQDKIVEYLADVVEQSKAYQIRPVLENYSAISCPFATVEDIAYLLDKVPGLDYVLDCGNFWFNNSDVLEAANRFADKTIHVHLKDVIGNPDGAIKVDGNAADSVAIGDGEIPFPEIFSILKKSGYNGGLTIEINSSPDLFERTKKSLDYLNRVL